MVCVHCYGLPVQPIPYYQKSYWNTSLFMQMYSNMVCSLVQRIQWPPKPFIIHGQNQKSVVWWVFSITGDAPFLSPLSRTQQAPRTLGGVRPILLAFCSFSDDLTLMCTLQPPDPKPCPHFPLLNSQLPLKAQLMSNLFSNVPGFCLVHVVCISSCPFRYPSFPSP